MGEQQDTPSFQGRVFRRQVAKLTTLDSAWNGPHLRLGAYHLWIDASGRLRSKSSAPTGDADGTIVGTQS